MCGIVALFLNRPLDAANAKLGSKASYDLRHRGPDAAGEWTDSESGVYLGHRRLTVIDLTDASNQPMVIGNQAVTYNGEIYNYRDVRERLRGMGQTFSTAGDTEVLMAAWRQFGPDAVDVFEGMFAFALWDGQDGWLATDRYGEKPLFYAIMPDGVAVASELPTLARMTGAGATLDQEGAAAFVSLGYLPGPGTVYPNIRRAPPATIFRITGGKIVDERRYWTPPVGEPGRGRIEQVSEKDLDQIQDALTDSVALRLEADVPTCLYLSSGVDSSLVAAVASGPLNRKLDSITVKFSSGDIQDESDDAGKIAAHLGLPHEIIENPNDPSLVNPGFFFDRIGQPTDDLSLASLHQMASAGRARGCKVGLTGLGGDELFFGYNKHAFIFDNRQILNSPEWIRGLIGQLVGTVAGASSKFNTYRNLAQVKNCERYLAIKNYPAIGALRRIPGFQDWASKTFAPTGRGLEMEVPILEFDGVLAGHRLPSTDAGSMRVGMEFRAPFLSCRLQETIAELDPRALLRFGQKSVLRRLLKRFLPDHLVDTPKRGFTFPPDRFKWMRSDHPPSVRHLPPDLVESIWRNRKQQGWKALATRALMLSEFEKWAPGDFAADSAHESLTNRIATAAQ